MTSNGEKTFYGSACLVCLRASTNIKRCSKCKIALYCSEEHQRQDWNSHKPLCQVINNCKLTFTGSTFEEFRDHQRTLRTMWKCGLKRELYEFEKEMTFYPRVCAICFSANSIFSCEKCLNAFYCSKQHKKDHWNTHRKHCDELRLSLVHDQYICTTSTVKLEFIPVDNKELYSRKDIRKHLNIFSISDLPNYLSEKELEEGLQMTNDTFVTFALNILHSLKCTNTIKSDIVIHIVIPNWFRYQPDYDILLLTTNIVRHWIPEITGFIKYYFIDPAMHNKYELVLKNDKIVIKCFVGTYEEVMDVMEKPDIILAFDTRLNHITPNNLWLPSATALLRHENVPLAILTSTYPNAIGIKEILIDSKHIAAIDTVVDVSENPFGSIAPLRNGLSQFEPIVYIWKYIIILKRTPKANPTQHKSIVMGHR